MVQFIAQLAFRFFLGLPLIAWGGIITFISLFLTAYYGNKVHQGKADFKMHKIFIILTMALALIHGIIAILIFISQN